MEFTQEFIQENNLSEEQVSAISSFADEKIAEVKNEAESTANTNAQNIIQGAIDSTQQKLGITGITRNQGEKHADYLSRMSEHYFNSKNTEIDNLKTEYQHKIENANTDDGLKTEFDTLKTNFDQYKQKYADYDDLKEKADKYDNASTELNGLKDRIAFDSIKPNFPDTANKWEVSAKWESFRSTVLKDHDIEIVDNKAKAISKENKHRIVDLEDLLKKDQDIQGLLEGRKQDGPGGADPVKLTSIDGVPFDVPEGADSKKRAELIREYLTGTKKIPIQSPEFSKEFSDINSKILNARKSA